MSSCLFGNITLTVVNQICRLLGWGRHHTCCASGSASMRLLHDLKRSKCQENQLKFPDPFSPREGWGLGTRLT